MTATPSTSRVSSGALSESATVSNSTAHLKVTDDGAVRVLRLSNPDKRNALTRDVLAALQAALPTEHASTTQPIRCVVLTGDEAGGAFSSGYDITAIDDKERERGLDPIGDAADAIEHCPTPVVAAIDGAMFGGAFELAMACDVRFMSSSSSCGMPPARLGLVYAASGLQRFLRATSVSSCQSLFLRGKPITADVAYTKGFVDECIRDGTALQAALAFASDVAVNAPLAVSGMCEGLRRLARARYGDDLDAAEAFIATARDETVASDDIQEGVRAFHERRSPVFKGT